MDRSYDGEGAEADAVIVGGGVAGLTAALLLGRARRRVVVLDAGEPRNAPTLRSHSLFTRDGTPPGELLRIAREQALAYPTVALVADRADEAGREADGSFGLATRGGRRLRARRLVLATGLRDELPPIQGIHERWGASVFHCPYCHGYEARDEPLGILAAGEAAVQHARTILGWTSDVIVFTDGAPLAADTRATLARLGVGVREERVAALVGQGRTLEAVLLESGERVPRRAALMRPPTRQGSALAERLGCALTPTGLIQVAASQETTVPGVYAAGDCTRQLHQLAFAVADGTNAAIHLNRSLLDEEHPL